MSTQIKIRSIAVILFITSSCSVNKQNVNKEFIGSDEVGFIEFYQTQEGEVISGQAPQGRRIDGPTYRFDSATKKLEILRRDKFSLDSVKAFLGNGKILKGTAGSGLSMRLTPIYRFPFSMNNLTIHKLTSSGLYLTFEKKDILLQDGQEWNTSTVKVDTFKTELPAIVKITTTYSIHYHGKMSKKGITD